MITRQEKILSCIDPRTQIGIEIGALDKPIVTRDKGKIYYVDHATTEELREKYAQQNVDVSQIVQVDYVWGTQTLPELLGPEIPFDYIIASHVIEHVPDFVGWLKEIHAVLKPGAVLSLAIPDKRYCLDFYRPTTKVAEVFEAYLKKSRRPSPGQIFEFLSSAAFWNGQIAWAESAAGRENEVIRLHSTAEAWQITNQVISTDQYYDVHCWVFTPVSFFELLKALIQMGLFDFKVVQFYSTEGCEFYVSLEAMDLSQPESDRQIVQLESLPEASEETVETCHTKQLQQLATELSDEQARLWDIQNKLKDSRDSKKRLKAKVLNLQERVKTYEDEINSMRSSKFWQLRTHWMNLRKLLNL